MTDETVEAVARAISGYFCDNRQPDMSGDPFAKMLPHRKRDCFDAARAAIAAHNDAIDREIERLRAVEAAAKVLVANVDGPAWLERIWRVEGGTEP